MTTVLDHGLEQQLARVMDQDRRMQNLESLGNNLYEVFRGEGAQHTRVSTQVRNLQQVAATARRLADVEAFVKNQMGRESKSGGLWRDPRIGPAVIDHLNKLREIAAEEAGADRNQQLGARLWLVRNWSRSVVAAYMFAKAQAEMKRPDRAAGEGD